MIQVPTENDLVDAIADAARAAISDLFQAHSGETFYYCSLITTGEGHPPVLSAWSKEALARAVGNEPDAEAELKWSYADSPFCGYGQAHFDRLRDLFDARPAPDLAEVGLRLSAMEQAISRLDAEGLFGVGSARERLVVNAEVMPPDRTNVERATRLNPPAALIAWLAEAAEPEEQDLGVGAQCEAPPTLNRGK